MLADLFLAELERQEQVPPSIDLLGNELARRYKEQAETLSSIAAMYVQTFNELADLKAKQVQSR